MASRRAAANLSALGGAAVLFALGAWLLADGERPPAPAPRSPPPQAPPRAEEPVPVPGRVPPWEARAAARRPPSASGTSAPEPPLEPFVPAGASPWARLRLVDSMTGETIPPPFLVWVVATVPGGKETDALVFPTQAADDHRVEVFPAPDERPGGRFAVRVAGYETAEFPSREELAGERVVALVPAAPDVKGSIALTPGLEDGRLRVEISPAGPSGPRRSYLMTARFTEKAGPFEIFDVPAGSYRIDVWVLRKGTQAAHAARVFEKAGDPVDLGEILVLAPATVLARVVARDGTPVLDRGLAIQRVGEGGDGSGGGEPDRDGWVAFRGLEPGTEYRVVSSLEGVEGVVRAPTGGGGEARVELRWENEGVRCRLRFTVDGQDPGEWGDIFEGPALEKGSWRKDGFLEHDMAPGDYLFGIWARPAGKDGLHRYWAEFTVPGVPLWEKTIDLAEGRR